MNIALIGSGGREDALCRKLKDSKKINKIFCIPGNAGTQQLAKNIDLDRSVQILQNVPEVYGGAVTKQMWDHN